MGRFKLIEIEGKSMQPKFKDGEFCIIDSSKKTIKSIEVGDVIVFRFSKDQKDWHVDNDYAIKRVYKNVPTIIRGRIQPIMWVLGDNRNQSYDSRMFGYISRKQIIGLVVENTHEKSKFAATKRLFNFLRERWDL